MGLYKIILLLILRNNRGGNGVFCPLCNYWEHFDVIWENQKVCLVFDNYGLHYGHLLLIPKDHVLNISCVYHEVSSFLPEIVRQMQKFFQTEILVYEHGNAAENQTSNYSIDHAHLHFLPVFQGADSIIDTLAKGINLEKTKLSIFYEQKQKYSYHLLSVNGMRAISIFNILKSEAFREAYAICEGVEFWDWKISGEAIKKSNQQYYNDKLLLKHFMKKEMENVGFK